jgi:hypothetical protein
MPKWNFHIRASETEGRLAAISNFSALLSVVHHFNFTLFNTCATRRTCSFLTCHGFEDSSSSGQCAKNVFPEEAQELIRGLRVEAELIDADTAEVAYSPDPDDNRILTIAIAGQANYVVSGDRADMLALARWTAFRSLPPDKP